MRSLNCHKNHRSSDAVQKHDDKKKNMRKPSFAPRTNLQHLSGLLIVLNQLLYIVYLNILNYKRDYVT